MASLGSVYYGCLRSSVDISEVNQIARFNNPWSISCRADSSGRREIRISATSKAAATATAEAKRIESFPSLEKSSAGRKGVAFPAMLDEWMRDAAAEIVKNLRKAPLFVHVYASDDVEAARMETEKAIEEHWPVVVRQWKDGERQSPDGIILVEEIGERDGGGGDPVEGEWGDGTKAWGIVVQGKGAECGPACYVMKTSRVGSGLGSGCTHFCLARVRSLRESVLSQLTRTWLLG